MLLSWGPVVKLRNIARSLGITRVIGKMRSSSKYEERFGNAMLGALRAGDTVWDIGANVGFYTEKFSTIVGDKGTVVAFEPVPSCADALTRHVDGRANVRLVRAGLGKAAGELVFDVGDSDHTLGRVVSEAEAAKGGKLLRLPIHTGDEAVRTLGLPSPTFMKVDVEGHERDVLEGMRGVLGNPSCREVFVEIHFGILARRGEADAPDAIVRLLKDNGFVVKWVDASHVHATRAR